MIKVVFLFLHIISITVPCGMKSFALIELVQHQPLGHTFFLGYLGCTSSNCQAVMLKRINAMGLY